MGGPVVRSLRRLADVLQRSLFDEPGDVEPADEPEQPARPPTAPDVLRHPQANRRACLDGHTVFYALKRSRRRTIGFVVGSDGLAVSAPRWVAVRDIDAGLREKSTWILAKLAEQRERNARSQAARIVWREGATIRYLGRPLCVVLDRRVDIAGDALLEPATASLPSLLRVGLPQDSSAERLRDVVQSWLQREARRTFQARCDHFAALLGVRVTRLALSSAQTRWGSASAGGAVRLHWRLIHFSMATIDYVVAHELAHLREMNHGTRFWDLVRSVVPDVNGARSDLKSERLSEMG
jgi:predicted metal-dependent hydrolase